MTWSAAGPVTVALLLLTAGGFAGGIVRALLDMAAVVGGVLLGARLIVRRASAASPTLPHPAPHVGCSAGSSR